MIIIPIKLARSDATIPKKQTKLAAANDLYALQDVCIWPGDTYVFDTGIALEIPAGFCGKVYSRSGLSTNKGLAVINGAGIIDADYRGTIKVPLHNHSKTKQWIHKGDRIAQIKIERVEQVEFMVVDELSETDRGSGGFGSTGQ